MARLGSGSLPLAFLLFVTSASACSSPTPATDAGSDAAVPDGGGHDDAGTSDGGTSDTGEVLPGDLAADYCRPLAMRLCQAASTCGCGAVIPGGVFDVDACVTRWSGRCVAAYQPFLDAGAVVDADAAAACLTRIDAETATCSAPSPVTIYALCAPFLVVPADLGDPCQAPYCAGGAGTCAGGTCAPRAIAGASCDDMFTCATGLVCLDGHCAAPLAEGASCTSDLACTPPLHCAIGGAGGVCTALGASGDPCTSANDCEVGLVCEGAHCQPQPTDCSSAACGSHSACGGPRACAPRVPVGGACVEDRACEPTAYCEGGVCVARPVDGEACARGTVCAPGLGCDGDGGTCRPLPTLDAPCAFGETGLVCADGFACRDDNTCGPLPTEGMNCAAGTMCAAGLGCDFTPSGSVCIVPRTEGGACESDRSCAAAFHCGPAGTCTADLPDGSPCSLGNECVGVCGLDAGGGLSCRAAPDAGDPCGTSDECPSALACLTTHASCIPELCTAL
ncbi:MAG: hypothetical protein U0234_14105 [Sandaracinus sp.]